MTYDQLNRFAIDADDIIWLTNNEAEEAEAQIDKAIEELGERKAF